MEPKPIMGPNVGLSLAAEPWLSPSNAYRVLQDARVFRGRTSRRSGFDRFAQLAVTPTTLAAPTRSAPGAPVFYQFLTGKSVVESLLAEWNDPTNGLIYAEVRGPFRQLTGTILSQLWGWYVYEQGTDNVIGGFYRSYTVGGFGTQPEAMFVDWVSHSLYTGDAYPGTVTFQQDPELPVVGLSAYKDNANLEYLVAMNTTRLFRYNSGLGYFEDSLGSDFFTGAEENLFWTWPLGDDLVITNGVDRIQKYTGSSDTMADLGTTIGAGPDVIENAQFSIQFRNRLIHFNTTEGGNRFPRRARWSRGGAYETYDLQDFSDADTALGAAVTGAIIGRRLYVGFERGWQELVFTGDPQQPFEFEPTTFTFGTAAKMAPVVDGERLITRTLNGIQAQDANQQYPVDQDIPDYVLDALNQANDEFTVGQREISTKQMWWAVETAKGQDDRPNQILVGQYQEDRRLRWSTYEVGFNCFTRYQAEASATWDAFDIAWDDLQVPWDSAALKSGFPVTLCGRANGTIYQYVGDQDGLDESALSVEGRSSIPMVAETIRLAPYPGYRSVLGWVDIYADASEGVELTLEFRGNTRAAAYLTRTIDLTPESTHEKKYRRVVVNRTAQFHTITIRASGGGALSIDAIVPWFRRAGRMREFG